jgi:hypothetical protein
VTSSAGSSEEVRSSSVASETSSSSSAVSSEAEASSSSSLISSTSSSFSSQSSFVQISSSSTSSTVVSSSSETSSSSSEESSSSSEESSSSSEESSSSSSSSLAPPAAPQNLVATAGSGSISLSWSSVAGADTYDLYFAAETGVTPDNYASLLDGQVELNVTSPYVLNGLTNGATYYLVVIAKTAGVEGSASTEVNSMPVWPPVMPTGLLNDTGINWCTNADTNHLSCSATNYPRQDGIYGRDAQARAGTLTKVGAGAAGFDFTKLDAGGNPLPAGAAEWSCVRDNRTGLIWEVKTADGGLRDRNNTYTWYNPDNTTNGGSAGTEAGGGCTGVCNTHAYAQAVNAQGLCGAKDWRLPDVNQLLSIVHMGRTDQSIEETYFPDTADTMLSGWYWSSTPVANDSSLTLGIGFYFGRANVHGKGGDGQVRLVRSGQ